MSFYNKVVIVTGGSSGIGAATAVLFAKEGADVAIVGRKPAKLAAVAKQIEAVGKKPLVIQVDLSKDDEAATVVPRTIKQFGKLDVLINNAGIAILGGLMDGKALQAYDEVMKTNTRAVIHLTSAAAPHLAKTKGNVVITSSAASLRPSKTPLIPYSVSKAALDHFMRCAAVELAAYGVRLNTVNPGPVDDDFIINNGLVDDAKAEKLRMKDLTMLGTLVTTEEVGGVILFLASEKARCVTGSSYVIDSGWMLKN